MITVYCLRRPGDPPPPEGLAGIAGAPVQRVEEEAVGAWVSAVGPGSPSPDVDAVRAHDAVVRAALRSATPVPARFGTVYADEAALRAGLRERAAELGEALARVHGRVEMGLRVEWEAPVLPAKKAERGASVTSGRAYLDRRRAEIEAQEALRERAAGLLQEVEAIVAPEGYPTVRTLLPTQGVAGSVAHLVHRHAVGVYRGRVDEARAAMPQVRLEVTGPWAPYSFV